MTEDELRERLERLRRMLEELEENEKYFRELSARYPDLRTEPKETRH
jgi:deoxyadenosine/deoxycytidine kinase